MPRELRMNCASASEIHRIKAYFERFWCSGRVVGKPEVIQKRGSGKIWRQRAKVTWTHSPLIAEAETSSQDFRHRIGQRLKSSRSRYVPVSRNFAVFCVFGVSRNQ